MPLKKSLEQIASEWKDRDREVYAFHQEHYLKAPENERKKIDEEVGEWCERLLRGGVEIDSDYGLENALKLFHGEYHKMKIKMGIDPTIPDVLHLGHTVGLHKARLLQQLGCHVDIVIGDWTATIGDPSGLGQRKSISLEQARTYGKQMVLILEKVLGKDFDIHFNSTWHGNNGLTMEERDSIDDLINIRELLRMGRFEEEKGPITYKRFHYPVLQATDSLILGTHVEIGGIDQKTNLLVGRELQRKYGIETQIGFLTPLLTGTDGKNKMSKSVGNHIPLNMNPHDMYGEIMSIPDKLLEEWWNLLTVVGYNPENILPEWYSTIKSLDLEKKDERMELKRALAFRIVSRYHNEEEALRELREFERVFQRRELPSEIPLCDLSDQSLYSSLRTTIEEQGGIYLVDLLREAHLVNSRSNARRLIEQGGVRLYIPLNHSRPDVNVEEQLITNTDYMLPADQIDGTIVKAGKRHYKRLKV